MKLRFPIFVQILAWFFVNLALLSAIFYVLARIQLPLGLESFLFEVSGDRIQGVGSDIARELSDSGPAQWNEVLQQFNTEYGAEFALFRNDAVQLAGSSITLPPRVREKILEGRVHTRPALREPYSSRERKPPGASADQSARPPGSHPKFLVHTSDPTRYWVGLRIPVADGAHQRRLQTTILAVSTSLRASGLFVDVRPWVFAALGAVILSALLWLPFVRSLTRSVAELTRATERIADGEFDVHVKESCKDELGRLGNAVNRLAARLSGFVTGQKRFLGDVAHELCSPIARLQMALEILEQRVAQGGALNVEDLREEVREMSQLVDELLSFSKASLKPTEIKRIPVQVAEIVRRVLTRESSENAQLTVDVPETLSVLAEPELFSRALSNVVRNAIRYAGDAGVITIAARAGDAVRIVVSDCGPGVPSESLPKLFDPFYRVDNSRTRQTGGAGLGLTIVRTCIEACGGRVTARNREPHGLELAMYLPEANSEGSS